MAFRVLKMGAMSQLLSTTYYARYRFISMWMLSVTLAVASMTVCAEAEERVGVVTTLQGGVTLTRASLPAPTPLKFRDDLFVSDRITTGPDAAARILLGGHAVITIREHSVVTITEAPGVARVNVGQGRIAVAVAREKMRLGDVVEVRTPNAVAGIRGTVIVAEVWDSARSAITVLKGVIDVTRLENGIAVGSPMILNRLQRVAVDRSSGIHKPQAISVDAGRRMGEEFRMPPPHVPPAASTAAVIEAEVSRTVESLTTAEPRTITPSGRRTDEEKRADVGTSDKPEKSNTDSRASATTVSGQPAAAGTATAGISSAGSGTNGSSAPSTAPATGGTAATTTISAAAAPTGPVAAPTPAAPVASPTVMPAASAVAVSTPVLVTTPAAKMPTAPAIVPTPPVAAPSVAPVNLGLSGISGKGHATIDKLEKLTDKVEKFDRRGKN
jgi:hypothetical protein